MKAHFLKTEEDHKRADRLFEIFTRKPKQEEKKNIKDWLYEFWHGHPFLLSEEVDIICETRAEQKYKWMNDEEIQELIQIRINAMYKKKFPNAKWCGLLPL